MTASVLLFLGLLQGLSTQELSTHVRFLAGDGLEGRRAGTPAADQAAYYLAGALAAAGLEPAGENGGWLQSFLIDLPPEPVRSRIVVECPGESERVYAELGTVQASKSGKVCCSLVSAGYGVVLESHGLDDFATAEVRGKVVLIRRYTEFGPKADAELAKLGNLRTKLRNAAAAGAAAAIVGTHPDDLARGGEAAIPFDSVPGSLDLLVATVDPPTFAALETSAAASSIVTLDVEVRRRRAPTFNVLGYLPGKSEQFLVVGAHYDHLGWGGEGSLAPGVQDIHNGADDNASGTSVVLALAELLAAGPQLERGVLFALWGAEEAGLLGSKHWLEQPTLARERVLANLNLDMVGRLESGTVTVGSHQTAAAFAAALAAARQVAAGRIELREAAGDLPGGGGSDHMSFHAVGLPAMFFFSGLHGDYHKPSDDWDKLDYPRMAVLTEASAALLRSLAASPAADFAFLKPQAAAAEEHPRVVKGAQAWFGSIPDYGASPEGGGMQLAGASPGGPAEKAGLRKGDVLRKVGRYAIGDIYDFMDAMAEYQPGDVVDCLVLRDGKELLIPVTLAARSQGD